MSHRPTARGGEGLPYVRPAPMPGILSVSHAGDFGFWLRPVGYREARRFGCDPVLTYSSNRQYVPLRCSPLLVFRLGQMPQTLAKTPNLPGGRALRIWR
jgi:hypothetical protein